MTTSGRSPSAENDIVNQGPAPDYPMESAYGHGVPLDPAGQDQVTPEIQILHALHDRAVACREIPAILDLALELGGSVPLPQEGRTLNLWQTLATLGAASLTVARIVEPHLDALAILAQAGQEELNTEGSTWGVFAAQTPGRKLQASRGSRGWTLAGEKPWCSVAKSLSHALVTALTDEGVQLFAVDLQDPSIRSDERPWTALGLPQVASSGLTFDGVAAIAVGGPQWYLSRPGFALGGAGVAAVWMGGATALARRLHQHCHSRKPDQIALWHLGTTDQALWSAAAAFHAAAAVADSSALSGEDITARCSLVTARLRATVVAAAETVLRMAAHGMGPEPLAFEAEHAQRVADLELYLRQDHAERSLAMHGAALLDSATGGLSAVPPW